MSKRSLVMLANEYDPLKFKAEGSFLSEKLDGVRCLWLPFTRGLEFKNIPWANTARDDRDYICSGLWTRRGKPILAPKWWLDKLPDAPLDGELFAGRTNFDKVTGETRKLIPDDEAWKGICYMVFDIPNYIEFFRTGQIREGNPSYELYFRSEWINNWPQLVRSPHYAYRRFNETLWLFDRMDWWTPGIVAPHIQQALPITRQGAEDLLYESLEKFSAVGGEGVMLRQPHSIWEPIRSKELVKVKKLYDSEATIVGYVYGVGKYDGMVGAFRVKWGDVVFDLSGFTILERQVNSLAKPVPGEHTTVNVSDRFPLGSQVTFHYNELTRDGIPRFARYKRPYEGY